MRNTITLVTAVLMMALLAWGQGSTGQINGTIRDSSGLSIPSASVKATQTGTGLVRTVPSGADGSFTLQNLPVGPYMLEVTKEGFAKYLQTGIVLQGTYCALAGNPSRDERAEKRRAN